MAKVIIKIPLPLDTFLNLCGFYDYSVIIFGKFCHEKLRHAHPEP